VIAASRLARRKIQQELGNEVVNIPHRRFKALSLIVYSKELAVMDKDHAVGSWARPAPWIRKGHQSSQEER